MKTLILTLLLILPVMAQEGLKTKPRAVEPIRVVVMAVGVDEVDTELTRLVQVELRKSRGVAIGTEQLADVKALVTGAALDDSGRCSGYIAALLSVSEHGPPRLSVHTGASLQELSAHLAVKLRASRKEK